MELKKAEYLLAVYKHKNLTSAAEELFLSPQALSKMIRSMETEFGESILKRNGNRFEFTQFGEFLVKECTVLLMYYRTFEQNVETFRKSMKKTIRIDAAVNTSLILGNAFFEQSLFKSNDYDVEFNEYDDFEVDRRMHENMCDIGLCVNMPLHAEEYDLYPLVKYRLGIFISAKHPLAERETVSLKDVEGYPVLSRNENFKTFYDIEKCALGQGVKLRYILRTPGDVVWQTLIMDHKTVALALECIQCMGDSIFVPFEEDLVWTLNLAVKKGLKQEPLVREVMKYIREYAEENIQ